MQEVEVAKENIKIKWFLTLRICKVEVWPKRNCRTKPAHTFLCPRRKSLSPWNNLLISCTGAVVFTWMTITTMDMEVVLVAIQLLQKLLQVKTSLLIRVSSCCLPSKVLNSCHLPTSRLIKLDFVIWSITFKTKHRSGPYPSLSTSRCLN